jgi:hypothetical protein
MITKTKYSYYLFMLSSALLLIAVGCASFGPSLSEQLPAPTHRNWWNYYERGVNAAAAGRWTDAQHDFEVCLGLRSGARYAYPAEKWQARTYGVRFLRDYFPHRELGIALLKEGQAQEAVLKLEESLRQEPSGRAKYFLNEALKAAQAGKTIASPVIMLDAQVTNSVFCREHSLTLSGKVLASGRVRQISVDGIDEFIELAEPEKKFSSVIRLNQGTNLIAIAAADLNGRETLTNISRVADWRSPVFSIRSIDKQAGLVKLQALVCDDYRIDKMLLKQAKNTLNQRRLSAEVVEISLLYSLDEKPVLEVADGAGNALSVEIADLCSRSLAAVSQEKKSLLGLAQRDTLLGATLRPALLSMVAIASQDKMKPVLRLTPDAESVQTVTDVFYLEGEVEDRGGVASITVNGQEYLRSVEQGAMTASFGGSVPLEPGTNDFEVVAKDVAGNQSVRKLRVVSSKPKHLDASYRLAVGVPPFMPKGNTWAWQARSRFQQEFSRLPVRFRLLERDEGWDYIMRELGLSGDDDLADPRTALRIGKLLSAELLFVGVALNQGNGVTVQVRAVDSTDGSIVFTTDVYADNPAKELAYQLNGLFLKVVQNFPVMEGNILEVDGTTGVCVNIGASQGVRVGSKFVVVQSGSGKDVLSLKERSVNLEIVNMESNISRVKVIPSEALKLLRKGDQIYAR